MDVLNQDMNNILGVTPKRNPIDNFNEALRTYDMKFQVKNSNALHLKRVPKVHEPKAEETKVSMDNLYTSLKPKKDYDSIFKNIYKQKLRNVSSQKVLNLQTKTQSLLI
jgi:hypothetical protein